MNSNVDPKLLSDPDYLIAKFKRWDAVEWERWELAEAKAKAAGWRDASIEDATLPEWLKIPTFQELWADAPAGQFDLDGVAIKLLRRGQLAEEHIKLRTEAELSAVFSVRTSVVIMAATFPGSVRVSAQTARRAHATHIRERLTTLQKDLSDLIEHGCSAPWYSEVDIPFTHIGESSIAQPWLNDANKFVEDAKTSLYQACETINTMLSKLNMIDYGHDGAKDVIAGVFLRGMANAWLSLTGKRPGKTSNGLFRDFCDASWDFLRWPEGAKPHFGSMIARGRHELKGSQSPR